MKKRFIVFILLLSSWTAGFAMPDIPVMIRGAEVNYGNYDIGLSLELQGFEIDYLSLYPTVKYDPFFGRFHSGFRLQYEPMKNFGMINHWMVMNGWDLYPFAGLLIPDTLEYVSIPVGAGMRVRIYEMFCVGLNVSVEPLIADRIRWYYGVELNLIFRKIFYND